MEHDPKTAGDPPVIRNEVSDDLSANTMEEVTFWRSTSFAPDWLIDALEETKKPHDRNTRRREIVFAVCFAESYLFEWTRDDALGRDFHLLKHYFPAQRKLGVEDRYKIVLKQLADDHRILSEPGWTQPFWAEFLRLVNFRNGLVHGRASRPDTPGLHDNERPLPTTQILIELAPGWATKVGIALAKELHKSWPSSPPSWIAT